jgi:hypothetical protein
VFVTSGLNSAALSILLNVTAAAVPAAGKVREKGFAVDSYSAIVTLPPETILLLYVSVITMLLNFSAKGFRYAFHWINLLVAEIVLVEVFDT